MMINTKEFRLSNLVQTKNKALATVELLDMEYGTDKSIRAWRIDKTMMGTEDPEPVELTKEIAEKLGFEIVDMGDFWEFNKGDFQLIQFKVPMTGKVLTPVYILHSKKAKHIKVPYVHKLQNLYYEIEGTELILKTT